MAIIRQTTTARFTHENWFPLYRVERVAAGLLVLTVVTEAIGAFLYLDRSSLWLDELYSVYFINGSPAQLVAKTLRFDVHTPLYALFLQGWASLFGMSETALRASSAVLAVTAMGVMYFAVRPLLTRWASLLLVAAFPATLFWFEMAQNARPYALVLVGVSLLLGGLVRAVIAVSPAEMRRSAAWIAATALGFGFTHHYFFLLAGLVILAAMALMPDWRARLILFASGAILVGLLAAYFAVHRFYNVLPPATELWFANVWKSPYTYLAFLHIAVGGPFNKALLFLLLLTGVTGLVRLKSPYRAQWKEQPQLRAAFYALALPALLLIIVLAIAAAGVPTISDRNLSVTLPFLWFAVCALADWSAAHWRDTWRKALMIVTSILALCSTYIVGFRSVPIRENLREGLQTTAIMPGCDRSSIPVAIGSLRVNAYLDLLAYYAPHTTFRSLISTQIAGEPTLALLADRATRIATGAERCHALLLIREGKAATVNALARKISGRSGIPVHVAGFPHRTIGDWHAGHATSVYLLSVD